MAQGILDVAFVKTVEQFIQLPLPAVLEILLLAAAPTLHRRGSLPLPQRPQ
jgi:hypothetical protein